MARQRRRRAVVLESDDDDDCVILDANLSAPEIGSVKNDSKSEMEPKPKLQKISQQRTVDKLFEARSLSAKGSSGIRPLEVITRSAASSTESSRKRKGIRSAALEDTLSDHGKPTSGQQVDDRLWVDKHTPSAVEELVVHSRKVAEVKDWLEGQLLNPCGSQLNSRALVLTGPAGVGKTAVIQVLAKQMGIELFEWTTPVPELWQEYSHHAASGGPYVSKLSEFEAFLERGRKMSSLPIVSVAPSTSQQVRPFSGDDRQKKSEKGIKVLLIDDLPVVNDKDHQRCLAQSFYHLALSRNFPAIVVITDEAGGGDRLNERDYVQRNVIEALERGGAKRIAFNPVTVNAMKKLLSKVQLLEKCRLPSENILAIAESSGGDIRHAFASLQFLCLGRHVHNLHHLMWDPGGSSSGQLKHSKLHKTPLSTEEASIYSYRSDFGATGVRDGSLSLFHALGKFLHNKRHTDRTIDSGEGVGLELKEQFWRYPLNMEEPEVVLSQAHVDTVTVLAFLHENVLQFVDEDAADDVAAIAAYFSDTDYLLGAQGNFRSRRAALDSNDLDPSQISTAAANSIASRGVLFGNGHPAPRRWQSLRSPALWQVERQRKLKKVEMSSQNLYGILDTRALTGSVQFRKPVYPPTLNASKRGFFGTKMGAMELDKSYKEQLPDFIVHSVEKDFALETSFTQMCVEDDIEDC